MSHFAVFQSNILCKYFFILSVSNFSYIEGPTFYVVKSPGSFFGCFPPHPGFFFLHILATERETSSEKAVWLLSGMSVIPTNQRTKYGCFPALHCK